MSRADLGLPGWFRCLVDWSVRFANWGPRWVPFAVRKLPLKLAALVVAARVRGWL